MHIGTTWLFWGCIGLVLYSYVLYPALLLILYATGLGTRQQFAPDPGKSIDQNTRTAVAVLLSAFNEKSHIRARIDNLLQQDYPEDLLTIYVGSDGSTDGTDEILRCYDHPRVKASLFEVNRGKANVVNDLMSQIREPIVVFTDANTEFAPDAVRQLMLPFNNSKVGCVSGELKILRATRENQDSVFWKVEQFLKTAESSMGGALGANGAIYAIRRELYRPLAADAIIDDFLISMSVSAQGFQLVYRKEAIGIEDSPPSIADEYRRRVRIGIGNYQALFRHPEFFLSTSLITRFSYVSHKVLRWLTPVLLLLALAANLFLIDRPFYEFLFVLQLTGYFLCWLLYSMRERIHLPRLVALPVQLVILNFAFLMALYKFTTGNYKATWRRTQR